MPVDPATAAQVVIRTRFGAAMTAWQAMTNAQREAWSVFADGTPWNNHLGDDCRLTGLSMYLSIRMAALQIKPNIVSAMFDLPPCTPGLFPQPDWYFDHCTKLGGFYGFSLTIVNTHPTDTIKAGVQISPKLSPTINFYKGPWDTPNYTIVGPIAPGFGITTQFDSLVNGGRYFMRMRSLTTTDQNNVSSPWQYSQDASLCHV